MDEKTIGLEGLSARQRQVVEAHLPLVQLSLRRNGQLSRGQSGRRTQGDLEQEACLALIEAVRGHDAARHGSFAAYALSRMHFALSRYAHENRSVIRVPFSVQRRRMESGEPFVSRDPAPRVASLKDDRGPAGGRASSRRDANPFERPGRPTVGEAVRDRCERAMRRVERELKRDPRAARGTAGVVSRCAAERWHIPEPEAKTPIRELARQMSCSLGRLTHCEARFYRRVAKLLRADARFGALAARMRGSEAGPETPLEEAEVVSM